MCAAAHPSHVKRPSARTPHAERMRTHDFVYQAVLEDGTMHLCFAPDSIERWASFSCDYNPIHFDLAAAKRAGSEQLIVHGMLAVLPVKEALSQRLTAALPCW